MYDKMNRSELFQSEQQKIIKRLDEVGIKVSMGKRIPRGGSYSGLIGDKVKAIHINSSGVYNYYKQNAQDF
ncbi:hypothetical protein JOC75_000753 [Metabacillus crassostreae]|uniref:hypothetical protein n=1 Tax=Metabacillus crassostreae TaxID=929098 RepID=UPI00195C03EC|nr:hypothetical protein [Metabacillus crassostreae]MBM7602783.1 hypothetical protein [Metabacillus crassostreae]